MRHTNADRQGWIYRAVVTTRYEYEDGSEPLVHTSAYGPYDTKAPATRAVSTESHPKRRYGEGATREATGRVEMSAVIWIPAE